MRLERMIGFLDHGRREAVAADQHNGVEVVRRGTMFLALRRGENESSHLRIIRRA
jgi:hypothetical protein